jgi:branched-chain amino acid transport system permease protein
MNLFNGGKGLMGSFLWWILSFGTLVIVPLVFHSPLYLNNAIEILISALFGVSLNLLVGYTGLLSLGHCAFFAVGSYSTGILLRGTSVSVPVALLMGMVLAGAVGVVMGYFCTRLTRFYFAFLTLAFSQVIYIIVVRWVSLTGGDQGLIGGIPKPAIHFLGITLDFSSRLSFYYFTVILILGSFAICKLITESPYGSLLRCIRENQLRAQFIGINTRKYQLSIFVFAGIFAALSGGLTALNINGCYSEHAHWLRGADPIFMILIGGMKNFVGPIVGAAVLVSLNTIITAHTRFSALFLGGILIFLIVFARMGIADFVIVKKEVWLKWLSVAVGEVAKSVKYGGKA